MIVVYAGPTLSHTDILQHIDCVCLPPISHGDILKLLPEMPEAIGIIDGYFEGAPSVWHKEILYALDQGVHVYGSSSMGALRAAELHPFGMVGVGQIFEWYRDGVIDDDDEVAVLHGPEEVGFMVASEPMVNIRVNLEQACEQQIINASEKNTLLAAAKNTFYKKRSWRYLLELSTELLDDQSISENLKNWLDHNRIDLKKQDAVQMLKTMQMNQANHSTGPETDFHFEWSNVWDTAFYEQTNARANPLSENEQRVLDQLRLDADLFQHYREKALLSWAGENQVDIPASDKRLRAALKQFRTDNHLDSRSQLLDYMARADLDETALTKLLQGVSRVDFIRESAGDIRSGIIDQLKLDGRYITLLEVANFKRSRIPSIDAVTDHIEILPPQLLAWYFSLQPDGSIPKQLAHHLIKIDLDNTDDFYRLIKEEYLYCRQSDEAFPMDQEK